MKIAVTGCLHGHLPEIKECDLLIITGDICPVKDHRVFAQRLFLEESFAPWLSGLPAKHIVGVAGNHDFIFEDYPQYVPTINWSYLEDSATEVEGLKIWGTPYTPSFGAWAFMEGEDALAERFKAIPDGIDIVVSHGPPHSFGDRVLDGYSVGSPSLLAEVKRAKPANLFCSHIHEGLGIYRSEATTFVNASYLNFQYLPYRSGVLYFDRDEKGGLTVV